MTNKIDILSYEQTQDYEALKRFKENIQKQQKRKAPLHLKQGLTIGPTVLPPIWQPKISLYRHNLTIGPTGSGKTVLLLNIALQSLLGLDRHIIIFDYGDLIDRLIPLIGKNFINSTHLIRVSDIEHPPSLNVFTSIDNIVFLTNRLSSDPLTDRMIWELRRAVTILFSNIKSPTLLDLEKYFLEKLTSDKGHHASIEGILVRHDKYISDPCIMRMTCNRNPKFNFRAILDNNSPQLVLIDLNTRGKVPSLVSEIVGRTLTSEIDQYIFSRNSNNIPLALLADEAPSYFDPNALLNIISHGRKYRMSICLANQFISQWGDLFKGIAGNIGTAICMGAGPEDAHRLSDVFIGYSPEEIIALPLYHCLVRINDEKGSHCFEVKTLPPPRKSAQDYTEEIFQNSRQKYCTPKNEIEQTHFQQEQLVIRPVLPKKHEPLKAELSPDESRALKVIHESPGLSVREFIVRSGLSTGKAIQLLKNLKSKGLIQEEIASIKGRGRPRKELRITEKGMSLLDGQGGTEHREIQQEIHQILQAIGLNPIIEMERNGKKVDIGIEQNGKAIAIEAQISSKWIEENLLKDLGAGFDHIVIVPLNSGVQKKIEQKVSTLDKAIQDRIMFILASEINNQEAWKGILFNKFGFQYTPAMAR